MEKQGDKKFDLKEYVLREFENKIYPHKSLVELFMIYPEIYKALIKRHLIDERAETFFETKTIKLQEAADIPILAFRNLRCEEIVDEYLWEANQIKNEETCNSIRRKSVNEKRMSSKNHNIYSLHCPEDMCLLHLIREKRARAKEKLNELAVPVLRCPECQGLYTSIIEYSDLSGVKLDGVRYINIIKDNDQKRKIAYKMEAHTVKNGSKCFVYINGNKYNCKYCAGSLEQRIIQYPSKKNNAKIFYIKYCERCNIYYLKFDIYALNKNIWVVQNIKDVISIEEKRKIDQQERQKKRKEANLQRKKKREQTISKKYCIKWSTVPLPRREPKIKNTISVKDFVVRSSTFKCMRNNHKLQNIDAFVGIMDKKGEIKQTKIPAGYCEKCDIFFIMESTYEELKGKGILACRVSDEKTYLKNGVSANGMQLAHESILMQYGYNVSQNSRVTEATRRKILALLVDNEILTRTDIIGYLDFFINQRKNMNNMKVAIEKWKSDREFISQYKTDKQAQYGIRSIYRK